METQDSGRHSLPDSPLDVRAGGDENRAMVITRVWVEPGCLSCHFSQATCPAVFEVQADGAVVKPGADLVEHDQAIRDAADGCPAQVIRFEEA